MGRGREAATGETKKVKGARGAGNGGATAEDGGDVPGNGGRQREGKSRASPAVLICRYHAGAGSQIPAPTEGGKANRAGARQPEQGYEV